MGGGGWTSLDYPWMVTVTPEYGDTLTWSGRGEGGRHWTIHGWSQLLSAKYKATVSSMDGSGLSTAPLDISETLTSFMCYIRPGFLLSFLDAIRNQKLDSGKAWE